MVGSKKKIIVARATIGSHIALSGIYYLLAAVNIGLNIGKGWIPGSGGILLILLLVGAAWTIWLRGFKITISSGTLSYRDGLYMETSIPISEISSAKHTWIEWTILGRHLSVPRLVVIHGENKIRLAINTKPFSHDDLHAIVKAMQEK